LRANIRGFDFESTTANGLTRAVEFSPDRVYRYALWRVWGKGTRRLVVIGLNPSTADAERDDRTIRRCMAFAQREGCDGLVMLNLFAVRTKDPKIMKAHAEPIGARNDRALVHYATTGATIVLAAWGRHGSHLDRARDVCGTLKRAGVRLMCLGTTGNGAPRHPLYMRGDTPFARYSGR
jgi:hypothetical protein